MEGVEIVGRAHFERAKACIGLRKRSEVRRVSGGLCGWPASEEGMGEHKKQYPPAQHLCCAGGY
ncbi:protein of unknown function [Candidatus Methylomirabilis oxygeniifera]|uniref:Uncharacterized protein n=1 Tax=Methylomirabilis oxygeniifera TaxID=671143 RepID=D5MIY7_METO1|nr:protein of unknown function [Candidatus Methylomirabilis oxyfera]